MARPYPSQSREPDEPEVPSYHFDPKLGNPRDVYTPADVVHPDVRRPEVPARFVARVDGETIINTMWGKRVVPWRADPGTPCVILGYWAVGTIHLRWPAIVGNYRVDGRFPAWVVTEDPAARMAGGGRLLKANDLSVRGPTPLGRLLRLVSGLFRKH